MSRGVPSELCATHSGCRVYADRATSQCKTHEKRVQSCSQWSFITPLHIGCQLKLHPALSASDHHTDLLRRSGKQRVITYQQPYLRPLPSFPPFFAKEMTISNVVRSLFTY